MQGLIGDRFLKRFLKGIHRPSKPGSTPEARTLAESAAETMNRGDVRWLCQPREGAESGSSSSRSFRMQE